MTFAVVLGTTAVPKYRFGGRSPCAASSNFTSYVITICASIALSSLAAKKRPGLLKVVRTQYSENLTYDDRNPPCMSPMAERNILRTRGDHLIFQTASCLVTSHINETPRHEHVRLYVVCLVMMCRHRRHRDQCPFGNKRAI